MNKKDTLEFLCRLVTEVGETVYRNQELHDCFCEESQHTHPIVSESALMYIETAVRERMKADGLRID